MSESTAVAVTQEPAGPHSDDLSEERYRVMCHQAKTLVETGFLPKAINTPQKALAIILKGRELGVPPMYALSNIMVVDGKPTASAELMLALIYRDHGDDAVDIAETTDEQCSGTYKRRTASQRKRFTFSIADAGKAGLLGKDNWKKYPAAMLRARWISAVARLGFADTIAGLYTPEELGAPVSVDASGQVVISDAEWATSSQVEEIAVATVPTPEIPVQQESTGANSMQPRIDALTAMGKAISDLSQLRGQDPKQVRAAARQHLGISATTNSDLTLDDIQQICRWARTQIELGDQTEVGSI